MHLYIERRTVKCEIVSCQFGKKLLRVVGAFGFKIVEKLKNGSIPKMWVNVIVIITVTLKISAVCSEGTDNDNANDGLVR